MVGSQGGAPDLAHEAGNARLRGTPAVGGGKTRALAAKDRRGVGQGLREGHPVLSERRRPLAPDSRENRPDREDLRSEEHTSELQSLTNLVCRLLLAKRNNSADSPCWRH